MNKNELELTDEQKIALTVESFKEFCDQFGPNDIYKQIFLEVLFEELAKRKPEEIIRLFEN